MSAITYDAVYSDDEALESFWRSLSRKQSFSLRVSRLDLLMALHQLEELGACAIMINKLDGFYWLLNAYKGKQGPCYDTGRTATLKLDGGAALDDDAHILIGSVPVCEKTATIYQLPQYEPFIDVSAGDPMLLASYADNPKDFSCDNLDELSQALRNQTKPKPESPDRHVMYAGPFKCLIAKDGSMLWRGQATQISAAMCEDLQKQGVVLYAPDKDSPVQTVSYYDQQFDRQGAVCLMHGSSVPLLQANSKEPRFSVLSACSDSFKQRLLDFINSDKPYMIVTGSDPGDPLGCCPSEDVSQANALVEAGILEAHRQDLGGEACPVSVYTCAHEMVSIKPLETVKNVGLRKDLKKSLQANDKFSLRLLKWICLCFVVVSIAYGLINYTSQSQGRHADGHISLERIIALDLDQAEVLLLLREQQRCDFCMQIEQLTRAYVQQQDQDELLFIDRDLSSEQYNEIANDLDLFASTLVYVVYKDGVIVSSRVIVEAWSTLYEKESFFSAIDVMRQTKSR